MKDCRDGQRVRLKHDTVTANSLEQDALCEQAHPPLQFKLPPIGACNRIDRLSVAGKQHPAKAVLLIGDRIGQIGVVWPRRTTLHAGIRPGIGDKL